MSNSEFPLKRVVGADMIKSIELFGNIADSFIVDL